MSHTANTPNPEVLENLRSELRRGSLIVAVLAELRAEQYGYTLRKSLDEHGIAIDEGTLYPLLRRLETQGLLVSEWREQDKRNKRFYRLSAEGNVVLAELLLDWESLSASLRGISCSPAPLTNQKRWLPQSKPCQRIESMELIDRYLQSVKLALPKRSRDDVIRELSDEILSPDRRAGNRARPSPHRRGAGRPAETAWPSHAAGEPLPQAAATSSARRSSPSLLDGAPPRAGSCLTRHGHGSSCGRCHRTRPGRSSRHPCSVSFRSNFRLSPGSPCLRADSTYFRSKFSFYDKWDPRTLPKLSKLRAQDFDPPRSAAALFFGTIFGSLVAGWTQASVPDLRPRRGIRPLRAGLADALPLFVALILADMVRHTVDYPYGPDGKRGSVRISSCSSAP